MTRTVLNGSTNNLHLQKSILNGETDDKYIANVFTRLCQMNLLSATQRLFLTDLSFRGIFNG